jgi:hypothetical protein
MVGVCHWRDLLSVGVLELHIYFVHVRVRLPLIHIVKSNYYTPGGHGN